MKRGKHILNLAFLFIILFSSQKSNGQNSYLREFAHKKSQSWKLNKSKADSIALKNNLPIIQINKNHQVHELQRFEHGKPVYYQTENENAAATISVNLTWEENGFTPGLSGSSQYAGIWDAGFIYNSHQELTNRVIQHDEPGYLGSHGTHLSGTMIAAGINTVSKGMANSAKIYAYDFNNDLAEMASEAADGLQVSNHSYGPICGWSYNSSDDMWYWYGDLEKSSQEDLNFGLYTEISQDMDFIAFYAPKYLIVKSAGNDKNDAPESQPIDHYTWDDSWIVTDVQHDPDGGSDGFDCLSPMAIAKNVLTVGAVEDLPAGYTSSDEVEITEYSSWGPSDDGRIKPDLVANGSDIISCGSHDIDEYISMSGTSMAAASISGAILLLNELQEILQPRVQLRSSTIKGLLTHTANECGSSEGPDYQYGWGLANIHEAANLLKTNHSTGGNSVVEDILHQNEEKIIQVSIPANTPFFKATLCWTDPPGEISPYELNPTQSALVNNLDILLTEISTQQNYYPWILDASNPSQSATTGVNDIDNIEQIFINTPNPGNYQLKIVHQGNLTNSQQVFSLILSGIESNQFIYPPQKLAYFTGNRKVNLTWEIAESAAASHYAIYRNDQKIGISSIPEYVDQDVENNIQYAYKITAVYDFGSVIESIPTNTIHAKPAIPKSIPYLMNCESGLENWTVKAATSGWRLGDSDSLNCYYLDFDENTGHFFGIDSYSAGEGVHVSDLAISPTLNLAFYEDMILSFDYLLLTGIYGTINELQIMYRLNEASEWSLISSLPGSLDWKSVQFPLPSETAVSGCQLGFFYDDFYKWGMGAGLDNIQINGTLIIQEDISLESIKAPEGAMCEQEEFLDLTFSIKNTGNISVESGEIIGLTLVYDGIQKSRNYELTQSLAVGSSKSISYSDYIDPLPPGNNNLSLEIFWTKDQNVANNSISKIITVYDLPKITFIDPPDEICADSDPIAIQANPPGGTFVGDFLNGNLFNPVSAGTGEHKITYTFTDINGCTNSDSITMTVVPLPDVSFNGLSAAYCINDPQVSLSGFPAGGSFIGLGINDNSFAPVDAGIGTHIIKYNYTDQFGCTNTDEQQTIVHGLTELLFTFEGDAFCQNSDPIQLTALPETGTFYINDEINSILVPSQFTPNQLEIKYTYQNEYGCNSFITKNVNILALPVVTIDEPGDPFCQIDSDIFISAQPIGGTFIGDWVSENIFNPDVAGIGSHKIVYTYEDANSCQNADTIMVEVLPLPEVTFSGLSTKYCINGNPSPLVGVPSGGLFTGTGIVNNSFYPNLAGSGTQTVNYLYTDISGCSNSSEVTTTIIDSTYIEILNLQNAYCQNNDPVTLTASPTEGIFRIDVHEENMLFPSQLTPGIINISYEYQDENNCTSIVDQLIEILALPIVSIEGLNEMYCPIDAIYELVGAPGGGEFAIEGEPVTTINPFVLGEGSYDLNYIYTDNAGCIGSTSHSFFITSNPTVSIEGLNASFCPSSKAVTLQGVPMGGYFEGPGITGNTFTPKNLSPGTYQITYLYNENGCEVSTTKATTITESMVVTIDNLEPEYCPEDSLVNILGTPIGGIFSVNEVFEDNPGFNTYELAYNYTDQYNCTFSDFETFQIRSKPEFKSPENLVLTMDDTIYLPLENPEWNFFWPDDSTSNKLEIIGALYSGGENSLDVMILDAFECKNKFNIEFFIEMPTALSENNNSSECLIYPNPVSKILNIKVLKQNTNNEIWSISLFNLNGKIIEHWKEVKFYEGVTQFEITHLIPGMYFISIHHGQSYFTDKISIQR